MALLPSVASPMHGAMVPIASFTGTANFANYTFTNIPQTFQDIRVVLYPRDTNTTAGPLSVYQGLNNDVSGTSYSFTVLIGNESAASSSRTSNQSIMVPGSMPSANSTSKIFGALTIDILNYANTTTFKTIIARSAADLNGSGETRLTVALWRNTNAINSIIFNSNTNFVAGSTFTLYGIRTVNQ
jgi:hypothetical protein